MQKRSMRYFQSNKISRKYYLMLEHNLQLGLDAKTNPCSRLLPNGVDPKYARCV